MPANNSSKATLDAAVGPRYGEVSWERMIRAVEKVRERLRRAVAALEAAGVPYAIAGGNAVAAWVSRVDEAAVRNTQDVDLIEVGLVDTSWCVRLPVELGDRLQQLFDNPEG